MLEIPATTILFVVTEVFGVRDFAVAGVAFVAANVGFVGCHVLRIAETPYLLQAGTGFFCLASGESHS